MNTATCTVVAGASGVIGLATARHLASFNERVIAVSRRSPQHLGAALHHALDLGDRDACLAFARQHAGASHLVYTAVREAPGLVGGWADAALIEANTTMFTNLLDALRASRALRHVTLLQGTKAYGVHVDANVALPCRESSPRHLHANFYFTQEDALRERAAADGFTFTILRPQIVFGDALGSNMNPLVALGAYGALLAAEGEPLHYPGGPRHVSEAADAELVARAIRWSATAPAAANETLNVANGDVFIWRDLWPRIAAALEMEVGEDRPVSLTEFFATRHECWANLVVAQGLDAPRDLSALLGQSDVYADMLLGASRSRQRPPTLVSTIKIRQAGFSDAVDTEEMVTRLIRTLQERRVLPVR